MSTPTTGLDLPAPCEVGLPAKFTDWRPQQLVAIERAIDSPCRFVAQNAPLGTGKSLAAMGLAKLTGQRTLYLTATKGLQDQLLEFGESGAVDIRGRNAYPCGMGGGMSCEEGVLLGCRLGEKGRCPHKSATDAAKNADIVTTNYVCYLSNYLSPSPMAGWGHFDLLICDELHDCPDTLNDQIGMHYGGGEILDILGAPNYPPATPDDWAEFAKDQIPGLNRTITSMDRDLKNGSTTPMAKRLITARRLLSKLQRTAQLCRDRDWLLEATQYGYKLESLWAGPYAERYLFRGIPKVLLMSGTLNKKTCSLLGIEEGVLDLQSYPSPFDPSRWPLYLVPTCRVDYRMGPELKQIWLNRIDEIIGSRLDRKGIVHAVSFARAEEILRGSKYSQHMIVPSSGGTSSAVEQFKRSKPPRILISPSVDTGYDFPGDMCRYQVMVKMPMPDIRTEILKARASADPDYRNYLCILRLQQACGRGMRSKVDWCENFLIDDHAKWMLGKTQHLQSAWFKRLIRWVDKVPEPMRRVV